MDIQEVKRLIEESGGQVIKDATSFMKVRFVDSYRALAFFYSATKFAVKGLTEALSVEFERHGVRAADVLPGLIDTPLLDSARDNFLPGRVTGVSSE